MSETITKYRACNLCEAICGLEIQVKDNQVVSIRGDKKDPLSRGHICPKALGMKDIYEDPDRLKYPIKKTATGWKQISWEQAFDEVVENLKLVQEKYGDNAIGVYQGNPSIHNSGTTLFSPMLIRALKTKNRFSATSVDQLPHHLAGMTMFGHSFLLPIPDIDRTDFWLIMGGNPLVSNGSIMTAPDVGKRLRAIRERGGKVVVIDPRYTETAAKSDQHIFVKPGSDVWLLLAMVREVFERDFVDLKHLDNCIGEEELALLKSLVAPYDIEMASKKTSIPVETIQTLVQEFCQAKSAVCYGRMGLSTVEFGSLSHWLINCLNIITGNMDSPGGAMFPTPAFDTVNGKTKGKQRFGRWHSRVRALPEFGGELPSVTLAEEILTPGEGQIRAMFTSCGNPILSVPNGGKLDEAFESLDYMVSIDIYLNETTRHADIILPPATGLEVAHYDIGFHQFAIRNTAKYSLPTVEKAPDTKFDWEIFIELLKRYQKDELPQDESLRQRMKMQYHLTPEVLLDAGLQKGGSGLRLKDLKEQPHGIDLGALETRFPERLNTIDGKIKLIPDIFKQDLERLQEHDASQNGHLLLIGRRHLRSNNSWMHNSQRLVKGRERCTVLIHPEDAKQRNLENGETAKVSSRVGTIELPIEITKDMMPGVVSIPHGWGHQRKNIKMNIAQAHAGASANDLTDELLVDELTGNAAVNGVPVSITNA